ncbi:hypothetical protein [Reyranella sp.]|uniref:hypothetical protein n=1 Tax=Reyranella sp. TaxID=1929291 RepID=UPI001215AA84|nr:hypothetical protein [Reyranella sp.]TAJ84546.1 MAG: hypothetical protein EPO50_17810 [Reyranella sp.]
MNTPKSRKPRRYIAPGLNADPADEEGNYEPSILQPFLAEVMGNILTLWPHIEGHMIIIFSELIGAEDVGNARLMFRSIINQKARISVMKAMLEKSPDHIETSDWYDRIIDEFAALNRIRNIYAHGLWYTHKQTQRLYLDEETDNYESRGPRREVKVAELQALAERMSAFVDALEAHFTEKGYPSVSEPSSQIQPQQSSADGPEERNPEDSPPERGPPPRSSRD